MIRPMHDNDEPRIIELCREFWEGACVDDYGAFCESHTRDKLALYRGSGACFVTEKVDGMLLLSESTSLCNPSPIAAEVAWYVSPGARGGAGIELLKAGMRYCEIKGIAHLSVMYMQSSMPNAIVKIYDKLGFNLRETTYVRSFEWQL